MRSSGAAALFTLLAACAPAPVEERIEFTAQEREKIARLSPLPPLPPDPTNALADDPRAAELGKALFFDKRLSGDAGHACSTCHRPDLAFADDAPLSQAVGTTARNTPTVLNAAYNRWFFWDGRADSLWAQALKPIEHPAEMNGSRVQVYRLLDADAALRRSYEAIFGKLAQVAGLPPQGRPASDATDPLAQAWGTLSITDQTTVNRVFANLGKAIAAYERTLVTADSPFDRFARALAAGDRQGEEAISMQAKLGLRLFIGRARCILCHSGPLLSDLEFHNLGLGDRAWLENTHPARKSGALEVRADPFNGDGLYSDAPSSAATRKLAFLADSDEQLGQYKTPSLRNVALTAPYMHGGHFATLGDVVRFYSMLTESPQTPVGHRDELLLPLFLDEAEVARLAAFLETLSGALPAGTGMTEGATE